LVLISCHSPAKTNKNTSVKYLHVSVDIPDNLLIEVRTNFRSIPRWWGCKCLSEQDWNWVPLENSKYHYLSQKEKSAVIPVFNDEKTICKWELYSAEIGISLKNTKRILTGFCIYPKQDTSMVSKYRELIDTMQYVFCKMINQYMAPDDTLYHCLILPSTNKNIDYTFEGIIKDTAFITVIVRNDTGPIMYMDTTMNWEFQFRAFGKNEKIPGLNEKR
jgi:hypothetical protein